MDGAGRFHIGIWFFAAPAGSLVQWHTRFPVFGGCSLDCSSKHSLPPWGGWDLGLARTAHHLPDAILRLDLVEFGAWSCERVLRSDARARDSDDRRLCYPRPLPVLCFLGSNPDSDGTDDRNVRTRASRLCRREVLPVYDGCVRVHAGVDHLALRPDEQL